MPLKSILDHGCIVEMTCKFKLESPGVLRPATPRATWRQKAYTPQPGRLACISDASGFRDPWNRTIGPSLQPVTQHTGLVACAVLCAVRAFFCVLSVLYLVGRAFLCLFACPVD